MDDAFRKSATRIAGPLAAAALLAACSGPLDYDMRGRMGGSVDTSQAALSASTADRPQPDARGVLTYPNYQVAVARHGDTVADVANRVGLPAGEVARYNGMQPNDPMRTGEIIALPSRVGVAVPTGTVDIATLAGNAIDNAPASTGSNARPSEVTTTTLAPAQTNSAAQTGGVEPIRHKVQRGETAYTVARLYGVTPKSLAEWNGLDANFTLREGQYLLIPVVEQRATRAEAVTVSPGSGSPTPQPPSSVQPLPQDEPSRSEQTAAAKATPAKPVADIGQATSNALMVMPVSGSIVREYSKGKNEGIDISAPAGSAVKAAASGTVAAITRNTENVQIVVIRHPDEVLSIYTHLDALQVKKGDAVSRGQTIGSVRAADPAFLHFEVRKGFESIDPMTYLR